jgi:hypothetical protein
MREFVVSNVVFDPLEIDAVSVLAVARHTAHGPWKSTQHVDIENEVIALVRARIAGQEPAVSRYRFDIDAPALSFEDGGVLVRRSRSPFRFQDVYDMAMRREWTDLQQLFAELDLLQNLDDVQSVVSVPFIRTLARTSARLLNEGIVHGQLFHLHNYQNLTFPFGELCDFDHVVISPHHNLGLAQQVESELGRFDDECGTSLVVCSDTLKELFVESVPRAANSLMEQAYYLFSTSLRLVDLLVRTRDGGSDQPGSVLSRKRIHDVREAWIDAFLNALTVRGRSVIDEVVVENDLHGFATFDGIDRAHGWPSILGWTRPTRQFFHYAQVCTVEDARYISTDFREFVAMARAAQPTTSGVFEQ